MTLKLKGTPGAARIAGVRPETVLGIQIAAAVFADKGYDCTITSVTEGKHGRGSLHFQGAAFDLRSHHILDDDLPIITDALRDALGIDFDVVLEADHFHVEYQPKVGLNQS